MAAEDLGGRKEGGTAEGGLDARAYKAAGGGKHHVSFSVMLTGSGLLSYFLCIWIISTAGLGDKELEDAYHQEVSKETYQWPMVAFGTALMLNLLQLMFERESTKFQLALVACYINFLAGTNDYLSWRGSMPICRDTWGQGLHLGRVVMWLHTTVPMVYLLSMISDFSQPQVYLAMAVDACMILLGITAHLTMNKAMASLMYVGAFICFGYVIHAMWRMFNAAMLEARNDGSRISLQVLRLFTVGLWFSFPITFLATKLGLLSLSSEEWAWTIGDFLGKVMFSSSLLMGNFLTIEQRRLIAMRIVEEGNRIRVIQELRELIEQKERFMSGMSHELRTPLNGIIGLSEAMTVGSCGELAEPARKTINTIKTSGQRLLTLINDILDAASMKQGKLTIKHERVRLARVVGDVLDLSQPLAKRGVRLVQTIPPDLPPVLGDTGRIIQILHNLVGNSCKFTHHGHIMVTALHKLDEIEVMVTDTGIGIPEGKFESIFAAFEQVDMSTTRKYGGTGLGLNLVKQLVEAHGGTITVRSKLGVGTSFTFSLKVWDNSTDYGARPDTEIMLGAGTDGSKKGMGSISHDAYTPAAAAAGVVAAALPAPPAPAPASVSPPSNRPNRSMGVRPPVVNFKTPQPTASPASALTSSLYSNGTSSHNPGAGSNHAAASQTLAGRRTAPTPAAVTADADGDTDSDLDTLGPLPLPAIGSKAGGRKSYDAVNVSGPLDLEQAAMLASGLQSAKKSAQAAAAVATGAIHSMGISKPPDAKIHVLSVDDDPVNQMVISSLLNANQYTITQVMDGQEALDVLEEMETLPDVILLDVMMPGMDGYEVCRIIRDRFPLSCIPIIMVSAKSKEENIVQGLTAGSNDYMVKPFGRQEILARISAHLKFRNDVYQAGEQAASEQVQQLRSNIPAVLAPLLLGNPARGLSLPPSLASQLESGEDSMQVSEQLACLTVRLLNVQNLTETVCVDDVAATVGRLHADLDAALELEGGYCADDVAQSHLTIVTGLRGEGDRVARALRIAQMVMAGAAAASSSLPGKRPLLLSLALHTAHCTGVVVGTSHPSLLLTGPLPVDCAQLLAACPPGQLLLSSAAHAALPAAEAGQLSIAQGALWRYKPVYLLTQPGRSEQAIKQTTEFAAAKLSEIGMQPGGVATNAARLRPVQRAFMEVVRVAPVCLLELGNASLASALGKLGARPQGTTKSQASQHPPEALLAAYASHGGSSVQDKDSVQERAHQMARVAREKALIERELGEVTAEVDRLADENDALHAQLAELQEQMVERTPGAGAVPQPASGSAAAEQQTEVVQQLRGRVEELEGMLMGAQREGAAARAAAETAQARVSALQEVILLLKGVAQPPAPALAAPALISPLQGQGWAGSAVGCADEQMTPPAAAAHTAQTTSPLLHQQQQPPGSPLLSTLTASSPMLPVPPLRGLTSAPPAPPALPTPPPARGGQGEVMDAGAPPPGFATASMGLSACMEAAGVLSPLSSMGGMGPGGYYQSSDKVKRMSAAAAEQGHGLSRGHQGASITSPAPSQGGGLSQGYSPPLPLTHLPAMTSMGRMDSVGHMSSMTNSVLTDGTSPYLPHPGTAYHHHHHQQQQRPPGGQSGIGRGGAPQYEYGGPGSVRRTPSVMSGMGSITLPRPLLTPDAYHDMGVLLDELGLASLCMRFTEEQISPDMLPMLDEATLVELGAVSLGARMKLRMAAEMIRSTTPGM